MQLPEDIAIDFRHQLELYERENHMPYIASIERLAKKEGREQGLEEGREQGLEEGREEGLLAGKIQILQQILGDPVESELALVNQSIDLLSSKLLELQQRLDSRDPS